MKSGQAGASEIDVELHRPSRKANRKWAFVLTILTTAIAIGIIVVLVVVLTNTGGNKSPMPKIQAEYQDKANQIINYCMHGDGKGKAYEWVANLSDTFGHRKIGSDALERAIDRNVDQFTNEYGLSNVHTENASLALWVRGVEEVYLLSPRIKKLAVLGLGTSIGTNGNLTGEAVVVTSWDDLDARCNLTDDRGVKDKIVVYNPPWVNYGTNSRYRTQGATRASRCGALAVLIRSAASFSIDSPHTGQQNYVNGVKKIPAISLSTEDADLLQRLQERGEKLVVNLYVTSYNDDSHAIISRNTIFDLPGALYPKQFVMVNGHFDSWDVGSGAMDNGGGSSVALWAIVNLKQMIDQGQLPRPKRSIRGILWTAEEPGHSGSQQYYESHKNDPDPDTYVFLQEADEGFFRPLELTFSGSDAAKTMFQEQIFPLLSTLKLTLSTGSLGDSEFWAEDGVPGAELSSSGIGYERYFAFHHTQGDTPSVYGKNDLDSPTAAWAVLAYVLADMEETLPVGPVTRRG